MTKGATTMLFWRDLAHAIKWRARLWAYRKIPTVRERYDSGRREIRKLREELHEMRLQKSREQQQGVAYAHLVGQVKLAQEYLRKSKNYEAADLLRDMLSTTGSQTLQEFEAEWRREANAYIYAAVRAERGRGAAPQTGAGHDLQRPDKDRCDPQKP